MIHANAGKSGNSLSAWSYGVCSLANKLLEMGEDISTVANLLSNITTGNFRIGSNGVKIYAGPDAIRSALLSFIKDTYHVEARRRS